MLRNCVQRSYVRVIIAAIFFGILYFFATAYADRASAANIVYSDIRKPAPVQYVTTAYYLNVRSKSSADSQILKVLEQGSKLTIVGKTANGWLKLEGQGYIHGGYAVPLRSQTLSTASLKLAVTKKPAAVKIASAKKAPKKNVSKKTASIGRTTKYAVQSASGLSLADIKSMFKGTSLAGHGLEQAVLDVEAEYGINAYFTIAVMRLESGNGSSGIAKSRNNLFGLNSSKGYIRFETKVDSVEKFGQLISDNYIGKGYTTIEKIAKKYCPANSKWPTLIKNTMNSDYRKMKAV